MSCRVYLGYSVRNRQKFSKTRCPYNTNGLATFNIVQLCGDVQPNPGPDDGALKPAGNLINRVTVGASIPTIVSSYRPTILVKTLATLSDMSSFLFPFVTTLK